MQIPLLEKYCKCSVIRSTTAKRSLSVTTIIGWRCTITTVGFTSLTVMNKLRLLQQNFRSLIHEGTLVTFICSMLHNRMTAWQHDHEEYCYVKSTTLFIYRREIPGDWLPPTPNTNHHQAFRTSLYRPNRVYPSVSNYFD